MNLKHKLFELLEIQNNDKFLNQFVMLNDKDVSVLLTNHEELRKKLTQKSQNLLHEMNIQISIKPDNVNYRFVRSNVLMSLLSPNQRGAILFLIHQLNTPLVCYQLCQQSIEFDPMLVSSIDYFARNEINQINDNFYHLEKNSHYEKFIEKAIKPYLSKNDYYLFSFILLTHSLKKAIFFNEMAFKKKMGLINKEIHIKAFYKKNNLHLIDYIKKEIFFDDWDDEIKLALSRHVGYSNPFSNLGLKDWKNHLEDFNDYFSDIDKTVLKNELSNQLQIKKEFNEKIKI